jgi:hypothetical protein
MSTGTSLLGAFLGVVFVLAVVGTCIEITGCGDKPEVNSGPDAEALFEAAKFRRLA